LLNRVSRDVEKRVLEMHFNGIPRDTTARKLGISSATVSEILSILPPILKPTRDCSVELRKNNLIARDALLGVGILKHLRDLEIKPDQFSASLQAVKKMATEAEYELEDIVQAGTKLVELENQSGKSYPEAIKELEMVNQKTREEKQQYRRHKKQNSRLTREIDENMRRRNEILSQANIAHEDIAEYKALREALHRYGLEIKDAKKLRDYLDNINETECDPKRFVSFTKKQRSIKKFLASAKEQTQRSQDELTKLHITEKQKLEAVSQLTREENRLLTAVLNLRAEVYSLETKRAQLASECWELETLTKAIIITTARKSGIPDSYIENLQLDNQLDVLKEQIKIKFPEFFKESRPRLT
jgi:chromosome segregation ATPase